MRALQPVFAPVLLDGAPTAQPARPDPQSEPFLSLPACPGVESLPVEDLYLIPLTGPDSSRGQITATIVAVGGEAQAKRGRPTKEAMEKRRALHDLGFFPLGVGGARGLQVLVRPSG